MQSVTCCPSNNMKYFENRIKCGTTTVHMRQLLLSIARPSMKSITLQLFIGGEGEEKDMFTPATQTLGRTNTIFQKNSNVVWFCVNAHKT